jgi:hypothetical protein
VPAEADLHTDYEGVAMQAVVGDRLHMHSNVVGYPERMAEVVEVRGAGGEPPYLVRFDGGDISLVFPGPDTVVEHPSKASRRQRPARRG